MGLREACDLVVDQPRSKTGVEQVGVAQRAAAVLALVFPSCPRAAGAKRFPPGTGRRSARARGRRRPGGGWPPGWETGWRTPASAANTRAPAIPPATAPASAAALLGGFRP